jgi:hypothetical protein
MASNFPNPTHTTSSNSGGPSSASTLGDDQVYEIGQPVYVKSSTKYMRKPLWVAKRSRPNNTNSHRAWSYILIDQKGISGKWTPGPSIIPDTTRPRYNFDASNNNNKNSPSIRYDQEESSNDILRQPLPAQRQNNGGRLASSPTPRFKVGDLVLVINETPPFVKPIPMVVLEARYSNDEWRYQVQNRAGQGRLYEIHEGNIELDTNAML